MDEVTDPNLSITVEGHQWYWSYQYVDFLNNEVGYIEFDSYLNSQGELVMSMDYTSTEGTSSSDSDALKSAKADAAYKKVIMDKAETIVFDNQHRTDPFITDQTKEALINDFDKKEDDYMDSEKIARDMEDTMDKKNK